MKILKPVLAQDLTALVLTELCFTLLKEGKQITDRSEKSDIVLVDWATQIESPIMSY